MVGVGLGLESGGWPELTIDGSKRMGNMHRNRSAVYRVPG
jgi:hypothetical protein